MSHQLTDPLIDTFKAALVHITNANDRVKLLFAIESRALLLECERTYHVQLDELQRKHSRAREQLEGKQAQISEERLRVDQLRRKTAGSKFKWITKELDSAVSGLEFSELMVERAEKAVDDSATELQRAKEDGARETRQLRDDAHRAYEACADILDVIPADPDTQRGAPGICQQFMAVIPVKPALVPRSKSEHTLPPPPPPPPPQTRASVLPDLEGTRSRPQMNQRGCSLPPPPPPPPLVSEPAPYLPPPPPPPNYIPLPGPKNEVQPAPRPVPYIPGTHAHYPPPPLTRLPSLPPPHALGDTHMQSVEEDSPPRVPPRPRYIPMPAVTEPARASPPPLPQTQRPGRALRQPTAHGDRLHPPLDSDMHRQSAPPKMPQPPPKPVSLKLALRSQRPASRPIVMSINNSLETQLAVRRFQTQLPRKFLIRMPSPTSPDIDSVRRAVFGHVWACIRAMLQESVPGIAKAELIDNIATNSTGVSIDVYNGRVNHPILRMPVDITGSFKHCPQQQDYPCDVAPANSQESANIRRLEGEFGGMCDPIAIERAIKSLVQQRIATEPLSQECGVVIAAEGMLLARRTDHLGVEISPLVAFSGTVPHPVAAIGFYVMEALNRLEDC